MSTVDASIPLAANPVPAGQNPLQTMALAGSMMQMRQQQQAIQAQNALKQIFSDPSSVDASGNPTPAAMNKIMAISPQVGMDVRNNMLKNEQARLAVDLTKSDLFNKKLDIGHEVGSEALSTYEEAMNSGTPEAQARSLAQDVYSQGMTKMNRSGLFSEADMAQVNPTFDPIRIRGNVMTYQQWKDRQDKERAAKRADTEVGLNVAAGKRAQTEFEDKQKGLGLNDAAKDEAAKEYKATGTLPPGVSRAEISDIVARASKMTGVVNTKALAPPTPVRIKGEDGKEKTIEAVYDKGSGQWLTAQGHQPIAGDVLPAKEVREQEKQDASIKRADTEVGLNVAAGKRAQTEFEDKQKGLGLNDAAKDEAAKEYKATGTLPPGVSRAEISDIVARASKMTGVVNTKALAPPTPVRIKGEDGKEKTIEAVYDKGSGQWLTAQGHQPIAGDVLPAKEVREQEKQDASIITDDAAKLIAERVLAGDEKATTGMARSAQNIGKVSQAISEEAKARGMDGAAIARKVAEFGGSMASERAMGTRMANMEIAANEVKNMAPLALQLSDKVDRLKYPTINSVILAADRGTGGEDVVRFGLATNSLIYMYAKFLNPNGIPTDADKARATDILSTAWSKGQFAAAVKQIRKEIEVGQEGLKTTKQEVGDQIGKDSQGGKAPSSSAPAAVKSGNLPTVKNSDDYDKLKFGDRYIAPDGSEYTKTRRQ